MSTTRTIIRCQRDPAIYPPPHQADVCQSMLQQFATDGWQPIAEQPSDQIAIVDSDDLDPVGGRIAVLCPGPSLTTTWPAARRRYAATIGVNAAACCYEVDWWCLLDGTRCVEVTGWPSAGPRLGLVGSVRGFAAVDCPYPVAGLQLVQHQPPVGFTGFTALAAIDYAFRVLGAKNVDLYGCDLAGTTDASGYDDRSPRGRSADRWQAEAEAIERMQAIYGRRLTRIAAPTEELA